MSILLAGLMPHPPVMVPEVGREDAGKAAKSQAAALALGEMVRQAGPDTLIMITPHGPVFQDVMTMATQERLAGDLGQFGAPEVRVIWPNNLGLAREIAREAQAAGIPLLEMDSREANYYGVEPGLDHGLVVPQYFLKKAGVKSKLVAITIGLLPYETLYAFGRVIQRAVDQTGTQAVVIASGDLSHRLKPGAPAGYSPQGRVFDEKVVNLLDQADVQGLFSLEPSLIGEAGECGFRPLLILMGTLDGLRVKGDVLSYEGPFGVGYAVAAWRPTGRDGERQFLRSLEEGRRKKMKELRQRESPLVRLARQALEEYIKTGRTQHPPTELTPEMRERAGAFVTIHKNGQLRGCIGTTGPTRGNLAEEIIHNAISSGTADPRFPAVTPDELEDLTYSVDVLSEPEPVSRPEELDPQEYGVIVRKGNRTGLLLPHLQGVDTVEEQLAIAKSKAGLGAKENGIRLFRFRVRRFE
ncbi:MAG: AmmeMemoRadiSam system protein A [Firmicutes bacterium]|nr:AmmeMemoRadiSam system protein A [Bacillota bacterium]MCL5040462.1 AmmeMemoRadiSam system protein A [Bacillota bacterium]